ncbi:MAG: ATP-binding protein [Microthrixaceae bacterium]
MKSERDGSVTVRFCADDTAAGSARTVVRRVARGLLEQRKDGNDGSGEDAQRGVEDAELVVSELVTNAVEHGNGETVTVVVRATPPDQLEVSVRNEVDPSSVRVPPQPWVMPEVTAVRGRGLAVVENLSSEASAEVEDATVEIRATVAV